MLEKTLESPLNCKEIKPLINIQPFIEKTDAEVDAPILWSPDGKSQFTRKDADVGKA